MNKIIFLDIDGVLNTDFQENWDNTQWDWNSCNNLMYIIWKTQAKIVISSSWRHNLQKLKRIWQENWLDWDLIIWVTPSETWHGRDEEIRQFLSWNQDFLYPYEYVAIDDEYNPMPITSISWKLVKTDPRKWITRQCAEAVIKQLNS